MTHELSDLEKKLSDYFYRSKWANIQLRELDAFLINDGIKKVTIQPMEGQYVTFSRGDEKEAMELRKVLVDRITRADYRLYLVKKAIDRLENTTI